MKAAGHLRSRAAQFVAWTAALSPAAAQAHSFGKLYNLPVPFWLYAWGAAAALVLSFVAVAVFLVQSSPTPGRAPDAGTGAHRAAPPLLLLRVLSLAALLLCVATGLFGAASAYLNINMTLFWVVFVLGVSYLTAVCGDVFRWINPWRVLCGMFASRGAGWFRGRRPYPAAWGSWPALLLYMAFIWLELFGSVQPRSLSWMLIGYSAITLLGAWCFGAAAWFRHGEFFGLFLRLIAQMAPIEWLPPPRPGARPELRWRRPFAGLLQSPPGTISELVFVLFMLSSTAFDGLHDTAAWSRLYWVDVRALLAPWLSGSIVQDYAVLRPLKLVFDTASLVLSPFLYLTIYLAAVALVRRVAGSALGTRELALRFAYTLLPIALVYHVTHYYTLIITQGLQILRMMSDPFGWGWNLFGTAHWLRKPVIPDMGWVWHTQVGLILFGHIVSVVLAHVEALRLFAPPRRVLISQLPMLLLMVGFTVAGLWILAQPIAPAAR